MKVSYKPVVDCKELENEVNLQFGTSIDLGLSCLPTAEYGSYNLFAIDNDAIKRIEKEIEYAEECSWIDVPVLREKYLVIMYLHDVLFPQHNEVLIHYYW